MKYMAIFNDFSTFLKGVLSIQQSRNPPLLLRYPTISYFKVMLWMFWAMSIGIWSLISLISLEAPRKRRALMGRQLFNSSALLTAKWRAVYPSISYIERSFGFVQAKMYIKASSDDLKHAQWRGVLPLASFVFISIFFILWKKYRVIG